MKKLMNTYNPILITTILLSAVSMQSMEINYEQEALQAEAYNQKNPQCINFIEGLLALPNEILNQIFCLDPLIKPLENKMKLFMKLRTVCKQFYRTLTHEAIGNMCQDYQQAIKNTTLQDLTRGNFFMHKKRLPALILICAGAQDHTADFGTEELYSNAFFYKAVVQNDASFVAALFKHNANPNARSLGGPILFNVKTKEIAQLFINHGVDVNARATHHLTGEFNVLWESLEEQYPSELMELYLAHNADATLHNYDNSCLLHQINTNIRWPQKDVNNTLKKAQLVLKTIPTMINAVNRYGQTPLDIAQANLNATFLKHSEYGKQVRVKNPKVTETAEKFIALFREHGALTAQELAQQAMPQLSNQRTT